MSSTIPAERVTLTLAAERPPYARSGMRFKQGMKVTSFHGITGAATAFKLHNTYLKPADFGDPLAEYWAIRKTAGLLDVTGEEVIEVAGPDALAVLDRLTPRRLRDVPDGRARYAVLCHDHGGIVEDGIIVRFSAERLWWIGGPGFAEQAIHGAALGRDVTVTGHLDTWHTASLQGPASRALLQPVTEADLSRVPWYGMVETRICGVPVVLLRAGYTAELGYDILVRSEHGAGFFADLWDAVRPGGARLAGSRSLGIRRVEASILNFGQDFDWTHNPYEIGLDWMVDPAKPGFIAGEALRATAAAGPRHKLIGLHLDGQAEAEVGDPVLVDGRAVGIVTSPLLSPTLGKSIAMAMVDAAAAGATTGLAVDRDGTAIPATIVPMPFFDPERKLAKS